MSISKPFLIYRQENDENIKIYGYDNRKDVTTVMTYRDIENIFDMKREERTQFLKKYAFIRYASGFGDDTYKIIHLQSGILRNLSCEVDHLYYIDLDVVDTQSLFLNSQINQLTSDHYQFIKFLNYKDISEMISKDLQNPIGVLPHYIVFGTDTKKNIEENINLNSLRMCYIPLEHTNIDFSSIVSTASLLKFNNSTVPKNKNTFITAIRVHLDSQYKGFNIREDLGYIHIPPMWAEYKIPDRAKNETYDDCEQPTFSKNFMKETFYKGMEDSISNPSWYSISFILLIEHNYDNIFEYKIITTTDQPKQMSGNMEDPRLYKVDDKIYLYTISKKLNTNQGCKDTIANLKKDIKDIKDIKECRIIEEFLVSDFDHCPNNVCINTNTYNILCDQSHKNIWNDMVFEKNYIPFSHENERFIIYMSSPFVVYKLDDKKSSICQKVTLVDDNANAQLQDFFTSLNPPGHNFIKVSQSGPAILYSDDPSRYIAPMHIRINRYNYENYMASHRHPSQWISENLKPFMNIIEKLYNSGNIIIHSDIYLQFLCQFTFYKIDDMTYRITIEKYSNPFLFNYHNQKFMLQFNSSISRSGNNIIFSFGEGDVLCRDVVIPIDIVLKDILIHNDFYIYSFRPTFICPSSMHQYYYKISTTSLTMQNIYENTIQSPNYKDQLTLDQKDFDKISDFYGLEKYNL